jgi:imidazole glycerol-phosphate synthase subunit HisH
MIAIVDYNLGNLGSVFNMLQYLGYESEITSDSKKILSADKLIISGVGSFDAGIRNLHKLGLFEVLQNKVTTGKTPILGICLGMQLMGTHSEEGEEEGFSWIKGKSVKFNSEKVRIPQMNWNELIMKKKVRLFNDLDVNSKFYFAHSFHLVPEDENMVIAESFYGNNFVAAVENENIIGVQFHPEKSHKYGMQLFRNFISGY